MSAHDLKIAIVHDWLITYAGAERVLSEMVFLFPQADLFSIVDFFSDVDRQYIGGKRATTTFIQNLPQAKKRYRSYLALMPLAIEQLDLSSYDLVISSSYAVAKGVLTGPDQLHLSYIYSPIRYAWDMQHQYLHEANLTHGLKSWLARWMLHKIRIWDYRTTHGVDKFVAISNFIARRVQKVYGRSASVVYPPVDVERFTRSDVKDDFYLTASRMVPYKKIPLIAEAFTQMPDKRLIIIGDGPEMARVRKKAGPNVTILGYQSQEVMVEHMRRAKAFVFAAEEDFGIAPLEAQACGTPVIAYGRGGALETIIGSGESPTGIFFEEQTPDSICAAVERFDANPQYIRPENCRANALRFSKEAFRQGFMEQINSLLADKK